MMSNATHSSSENLYIDWNLANKLASGKQDLAEELMILLIDKLDSDYQDIEKAYRSNDHELLLHYVHSLNGSVCYCGVPQLQKITAKLEKTIKAKDTDAYPELINQLRETVERTLEAAKCQDNLKTKKQEN